MRLCVLKLDEVLIQQSGPNPWLSLQNLTGRSGTPKVRTIAGAYAVLSDLSSFASHALDLLYTKSSIREQDSLLNRSRIDTLVNDDSGTTDSSFAGMSVHDNELLTS